MDVSTLGESVITLWPMYYIFYKYTEVFYLCEIFCLTK